MAYEETIVHSVTAHDRTYVTGVPEYQVHVLPTHELLQPLQIANVNTYPLSQLRPRE